MPMHCRNGRRLSLLLCLDDRQRLVLGEELQIPGLPGVVGRSSVSDDGTVRPDDEGWLAYDGAVLSTSSTSMFAMASSVHGSGRVEVIELPADTLVTFT